MTGLNPHSLCQEIREFTLKFTSADLNLLNPGIYVPLRRHIAVCISPLDDVIDKIPLEPHPQNFGYPSSSHCCLCGQQ